VGLEAPPGVVSAKHETMTMSQWKKLAEGYDKALLVTVRLPDKRGP
jgi:hypothetical protein